MCTQYVTTCTLRVVVIAKHQDVPVIEVITTHCVNTSATSLITINTSPLALLTSDTSEIVLNGSHCNTTIANRNFSVLFIVIFMMLTRAVE